MKKHIIHPFLRPALIAVLNLLSLGQVHAQTFTTLHSFSGAGGFGSWGGLAITNPITGGPQFSRLVQ